MNKIFNTTFESSLRILLLLYVSEDEQMTLDRIADYDFITIYSKDFGISNMALHGENEFGLSEFAARRGMMQSTMKSLVLDGLVSVKRRQNGFQYSISAVGKTVAGKMESEYASENLLRLYYIKEERIDKPDPLFEPVATYEKTLFLSSLLFLLTGRDFSEHDAQTKKEIKKARKEAVHDYVNQKIREANQRQKELAVQIENLDDANVEEQLREMVESLQKTESSISAAIETSQKLLADIMEQEAKVTECEVLLSRYGHLRSQYRADIQRLTFIVDGEQNMSTAPKVSTCPFCDGKITPRAKKSYIEASRGELYRIVSQMDGLAASEKDVQVEKAAVEEKLRGLKEQRADIEKLIQQELKPQASEIEKTIEEYRGYIQLSNEVDLIVRYAKGWEQDLTR